MTDDNQIPDPDDPAFFAKYTMPQSLRDYAFGPSGGTPPPRVVRSASRRARSSGDGTDSGPHSEEPGTIAANGATVKFVYVGRGQTVHAAIPSGRTCCGAEARFRPSETSTAYGAKAVTCKSCLKSI